MEIPFYARNIDYKMLKIYLNIVIKYYKMV